MVPSSAITRMDLSGTFDEFDLEFSRRGFIGMRVARPILVGLQAADLGKVPIEDLLQTPETKRAPGAGYGRSSRKFTSWSYSVEDHGHEEVVDDWSSRVYRDILDAEEYARQGSVDVVCRKFEIDVAGTVYDTAVWTGSALTTAITNEWDDHTNAVPIDDVKAAREKILLGSGQQPNALIINDHQFHHLRRCDQIRDMIKAGGAELPAGRGKITSAQLAEIFDLDMVLTAGELGIKNLANRAKTLSAARIWSNEYAMLAKVGTTNNVREPCFLRSMIWTGDGPGAVGTEQEIATVVEEYRDEQNRGSVIRVRNNRGLKVLYKEAAHLLSNVITI